MIMLLHQVCFFVGSKFLEPTMSMSGSSLAAEDLAVHLRNT